MDRLHQSNILTNSTPVSRPAESDSPIVADVEKEDPKGAMDMLAEQPICTPVHPTDEQFEWREVIRGTIFS